MLRGVGVEEAVARQVRMKRLDQARLSIATLPPDCWVDDIRALCHQNQHTCHSETPDVIILMQTLNHVHGISLSTTVHDRHQKLD